MWPLLVATLKAQIKKSIINFSPEVVGNLKLVIVEGSTNCEVPLQSHCHYEVDAGAQGNPGHAFDQNPLGGNLNMDSVHKPGLLNRYHCYHQHHGYLHDNYYTQVWIVPKWILSRTLTRGYDPHICMMHLSLILDLDMCMYDAYIYVPRSLTLMHVCMMHISMILDP